MRDLVSTKSSGPVRDSQNYFFQGLQLDIYSNTHVFPYIQEMDAGWEVDVSVCVCWGRGCDRVQRVWNSHIYLMPSVGQEFRQS